MKLQWQFNIFSDCVMSAHVRTADNIWQVTGSCVLYRGEAHLDSSSRLPWTQEETEEQMLGLGGLVQETWSVCGSDPQMRGQELLTEHSGLKHRS